MVLAAMLLVACNGSGEPTREGEVGSDELVLVPPDGWVDLDLEQFIAIYEAPGSEYGRLGALRAEGIPSSEAYIAETSEVGAALRGLEPETIERGPVDVEGAAEAFEIEFTSTQPVGDELRIRTLQRAILRTDQVLFDVRVEMAEDAWDGELARQVIDSVRLLDPPA
jgi:hypothetical protein